MRGLGFLGLARDPRPLDWLGARVSKWGAAVFQGRALRFVTAGPTASPPIPVPQDIPHTGSMGGCSVQQRPVQRPSAWPSPWSGHCMTRVVCRRARCPLQGTFSRGAVHKTYLTNSCFVFRFYSGNSLFL